MIEEMNPIQQIIEDDYEGIEHEETSGDEIKEPFDPSKIKVSSHPLTIDLLLKRIDQGALDLNPSFQREAGLWTPQAQSRLIESILVRIPIPAFYFDATDEDKWLVVDGLQRLTALKRFVLDKSLHLSGMEFLTGFNNSGYDGLPVRYQRRIMETQVVVYQIEQGTPPNVKFNIFKRINTGGLPLSPQEIRHALNQGPVTEFLVRLARSKEFLSATDHGINDKRMAARELVLRFFAFRLTPYSDYTGDFDAFLNKTMGSLNRLETHFGEFEHLFLSTMKRARIVFGKDAFRKRYFQFASRSPINKALFETWSVNLSSISHDEFLLLKDKKETLIEKFITLMNEKFFNEAISQGTGDKSKVQIRFEMIARIIQEAIHD
jgi:hypothetical protein